MEYPGVYENRLSGDTTNLKFKGTEGYLYSRMINATIIHIVDLNLIINIALLYSVSDGKTSKESIPLITLLRQILTQRSFGTHIY